MAYRRYVMSQKYPCHSPSIVPIWSSLLTSLFTEWKTQRHLPIMAASNSYRSFTPPPSAPPPTHQSVDWERSLPGQQPLYCLSPTEQNSRKKRGRTSHRHHGLDWWKKGRKRRERKEKLQQITHAGSQYTIDCSCCYLFYSKLYTLSHKEMSLQSFQHCVPGFKAGSSHPNYN